MRWFVLAIFWIVLADIAITMGEFLTSSWPKYRKPETLGEACFGMFCCIGLLLWAIWLLWLKGAVS